MIYYEEEINYKPILKTAKELLKATNVKISVLSLGFANNE